MKVLYLAPFRDKTGYGHAAENTARALLAAGIDLTCRSVNLSGGNYEPVPEVKEALQRNLTGITHTIQCYLPSMMSIRGDCKNVGQFFWETDNFKASNWSVHLNQLDAVVVHTYTDVAACNNSGVLSQVKRLPLATDTTKYFGTYPELPFNFGNDFVFYSIADFSVRKNTAALIRAYLQSFNKTDNVVLVLKTYVSGKSPEESREIILREINSIKQKMRKSLVDNFPRIALITDRLTDDQINRLHQIGNAYVTVEYGAGWNIPLFEAKFFGNSVICPDKGGHKTFIRDEQAFIIKTHQETCYGMTAESCPYTNLYTMNEKWDVPFHESICQQLQAAYLAGKRKNMFDPTSYSYKTVGMKWRDLLDSI